MVAGPLANWPACYGYAYEVEVDGSVEWVAADGNLAVTVSYYWCARWPGDGIGINWSYATFGIYGSQACGYVTVGSTNLNVFNAGAMIMDTSGIYGDGEYTTSYWICNGYAWDDSLTVYGGGLYIVTGVGEYDFEYWLAVNSPHYA